MATEVSICANALRRLGDDPITSLTDDTERARLCNAFYAPARDLVLRAHPWNFAITRATLAQLSDTPAFEYSYQYALPTSPLCLRVLQMEYQDVWNRWESIVQVSSHKLHRNKKSQGRGVRTMRVLYLASARHLRATSASGCWKKAPQACRKTTQA